MLAGPSGLKLCYDRTWVDEPVQGGDPDYRSRASSVDGSVCWTCPGCYFDILIFGDVNST